MNVHKWRAIRDRGRSPEEVARHDADLAAFVARLFTVTFERDDDGVWVASVREVEGCHTQGRTVEEARARIREALTAAGKDGVGAYLVEWHRAPSTGYPLCIYWSDEDHAFLAEAPELPGLMCDGPTVAAAIAEAEVVIGLFLEEYREEGREIPPVPPTLGPR